VVIEVENGLLLLYVANCGQEHLRTGDNELSPVVSNGHHVVGSEVIDDVAVQMGMKTI